MPLLVEDANIYSLASREFYESLDRLVANENEYMAVARKCLPAEWGYGRRGVWCHCRPFDAQSPEHGWKIHLSATLANAPALLACVCRYLGPLSVPFKFLIDVSAFRLLNSKRWPRGGSGKFITVYPDGVAACQTLLDGLHAATIGYVGPYILSDRRYSTSRVVHYRYGGFSSLTRLALNGEPVHVITGPDNELIDDERLPFFNLPAGISDPFSKVDSSDSCGENTLKDGRYLIESALAFANSGGVYAAEDKRNGQRVVVKEARPFTTQSPRGTESVSLLTKEYRILNTIASLGIAPRPVDFFQDWEHYYLAEEFVDGMSLRSFHQTSLNLALKRRPTLSDAESFFETYRAVYSRIIDAILMLHERGIVFGDLSPNNILISSDGERVTLIDFEGAHEIGIDIPPLLYTPGFAPPELVDGGITDTVTDCYSIGAIMLAGLMPINSILALNLRGYEALLHSFVRDLGFPAEIANCIRRLLDPDRSKRPTLLEVRDSLHRPQAVRIPAIDATETDAESCESLLEEIVGYIESVADFTRVDRLYPSAPYVFRTNPLSVSYGACGIALAIQTINGRVRPEVLDWILSRPVTAETYPPGLSVGIAGVSWALLELGQQKQAQQIMRISHQHPLLWTSPDLFYGVAGWGLAQLRLFIATGNEEYLTNAREVGRYLTKTHYEQDGGSCWDSGGELYAGLGHGAAGISLFLLRLYQATRDDAYLDLGRSGLEFVLQRGREDASGGLEWAFREGERTVTPYWRWGGAGIGAVLLRYYSVLNDGTYRTAIERIAANCDQKYSVFPGLHLGLAGVGEFFLDLRERWHDADIGTRGARKALAGVLQFKLQREHGVAFPGETRSRISCDLATGSAGIAQFLNRLLHGGQSGFLLDDLDGKGNSANGREFQHAVRSRHKMAPGVAS